MSPAEVDELLAVLRRHGVTSYADGPLRIRLAPPAPTSAGLATDLPTEPDLPSGVLDPRKMLAEAHQRAAERAATGGTVE